MGSLQGDTLNTAQVTNTETSAEYGNDGSGNTKWFHNQATDDGANVALGATTDAAITNPATDGTLIGFIRGILTRLSVGALSILKAEDEAHASGDAGIMALAVRRDTAAASSGTSGDYEPLSTDSLGRLRVAAPPNVGALSNARTTALDDILLVKASAGTLFGFQGYTDDDGFIVVIADADGTISNGAQCLEVIPVVDPAGGGAGGPFSIDFGEYGVAIGTGICVAFSSTGPTFTAAGDHMFVSAQYV